MEHARLVHDPGQNSKLSKESQSVLVDPMYKRKACRIRLALAALGNTHTPRAVSTRLFPSRPIPSLTSFAEQSVPF
jgi:hypothetical protein